MADIFISYASEDRDRVRPLAQALTARGFDVWWDRALAAGQDYAAVIDRELRVAKAVIVVWTADSAASTFVRDEAGRARDEGRLVPVLLDNVEIPLGFGAFQAEDFTRWNGGANAPQMQILAEALRAKLSGRDVDGAAIARKRNRLASRIRLVSVLTVLFLIVGIAVGAKYILDPNDPAPPQQVDLRAELLRLLAEGKLTPEQAIQLAQILEAGALGEQVASNAPASEPMVAGARSAEGEATLAAISETEFDEAARETYTTAFAQLATHSDVNVRQAVGDMADPTKRDTAMRVLWQHAQNNPDDPLRDEIYAFCGAVGESTGDPRGQRALLMAAEIKPDDLNTWRMLGRSFQRNGQTQEATAAAQVAEGVEARAQGNAAEAESSFQRALPILRAPGQRAFVATQLGDIAEQREDWTAASARHAEAYRALEQAAADAPAASSPEALEAVAQRMVVALDRSGRTRQACEELRQAQVEHDVAAPDAALVERCQTQFRVQLRPRVLEQAPAQRLTPQD